MHVRPRAKDKLPEINPKYHPALKRSLEVIKLHTSIKWRSLEDHRLGDQVNYKMLIVMLFLFEGD